MSKSGRAIIVGAGLAGLTAGFRLKQAGWHVKILESTDRIGGRVGTFQKNGYIVSVNDNPVTRVVPIHDSITETWPACCTSGCGPSVRPSDE